MRALHPDFLRMTEILEFRRSLTKKCSMVSARKALLEILA
jgi:hypothetical protein